MNVETSVSLNGPWTLYFRAEEQAMPLTIDDVKQQQWNRIHATVPGNVELDLVHAGLEKDPFIANNLYDYRKYEFYQWWFEREFDLPDVNPAEKQIILRLHGLDTFGTVWINGHEAGRTDNMMIEHELDIAPYVLPGAANHIAVRIQSPMNAVRNKPFPANVYASEHGDEFVWLRKPPSSFGWDIAPRLL
jgi:beta-mannosidase